jgi:hypothetical protein
MIMTRTEDWITIPNVDPGQLLDAWQTGMDTMMIPIDILRKMKDADPEVPFCCIGNNVEGEIPFIGEDNFFVHRLHKMGFKLLVNTDVQALHMDLASGDYTAHPDVDLKKYYTNIPIGRPLTLEDKEYIDKRWSSRLPKGTGAQAEEVPSDILTKAIESGEPVKFNMGCGRDKLRGYIGVDKYTEQADIKEDLYEMAAPDNCADEIFASHVIEHLPYHRTPELLTKWLNMLKPGGKVIIETPDLLEMCKDFVNAKTDDERFMMTVVIYGAAVTNPTSEQEKTGTESPHRWGYYPEVLSNMMKEIGYRDIQVLPNQGEHLGKNFRIEAIK